MKLHSTIYIYPFLIQRVLNALLCKEEIEDSFPFLRSLPGELRGEEKLQLHIDCMNALGEIISLEDVHDLGGAVSVFEFFVRFAIRVG